jgi:alpha,alpha-trehalose phosphorylase
LNIPTREIVPPPEHLFPRDEWRIVSARWTPRFSTRAETVFALSNGYVGIRGTPDEGRPVEAAGTFIAGFHETWPMIHAEEAYGLPRVGQTIVNVPDATVIELYVDDEPLYLPTARVPRYERVLDMRNGTLTRDLRWSTASGKHVAVRSCRLVSLEHRHVAAVSYEVTVDTPAPVVIVSRVVNRMDTEAGHRIRPGEAADPRQGRRLEHRVLQGQVAEVDGDRLHLGYRTANSGMGLALAVEHVLDAACSHEVSSRAEPDEAAVVIAAEGEPGVTIRLTKYVTYQTSRSATPQELVARCARTATRVRRDGFDALLVAQRRNLDLFWGRADVEISAVEDPVTVQQSTRWNLFQLAQATWRAEGTGVPAKGLTSAAYDGHYFWDTEAYVLPFLAYTQPRIARNLLRFRHSMLARARERAQVLGQRGACFPWRTINGDDSSTSIQAGTAQFHLNADIAYAIRRYVDVQGDVGFLVEVGAEILVETARLWQDLGFFGSDGRYHIHGVTGPDEYTTVVNDNAFTNLMARMNLRYAASAVRRLETERPDAHAALSFELDLRSEEVERWERTADAMFVPYDESRGITPQDEAFLDHEVWDLEATPPDKFPLLLHFHALEIYRRQVLKQADVVMATFLLGDEFSPDQKRRNFDYYDALTTGDSSLSASIQSIVASEIGEEEAALRYFDYGRLMDLSDVPGDAPDGVHIASSAGCWMAVVFGFGGVRDFGGRLTIDPRLPRAWHSLRFSLRFQDRQLRVSLAHDVERYLLEEGEPLEVTIRGAARRLGQGSAIEVPVRPSRVATTSTGAVQPTGTRS